MKKQLYLILLILTLGLMPATALAAEIIAGQVVTQQTMVTSDVELPGNDELYENYLGKMFYGDNEMALFGASAGSKLTGDEKKAYDALKPFITQIANGERESTVIALGKHVQYLDKDNNVVDCPVDKTVTFKESRSDFDSTAVIDALLLDMPYDMYWYNKLTGSQVRSLYQAETDPVLHHTFYFVPAKNYAGTEDYTVDTEKQAIAQTAVSNAAAIVEKYEGKSDYEKLLGYKDEICDLVIYHYSAGSGEVDYNVDIDPWQLIHVFDGNFLTDVVCEGYAKAFQYLCDLSEFKDAASYIVTGYSTAFDGSGVEDVAGAHMWNIVTLGGENYMVDVTNSDAGTVGANGELFMKAPVSGSAKNGYSFAGAGQMRVLFEYDNGDLLAGGTREMDMFAMVGEDVLTLAANDYIPRITTPVLGIATDEPIDGYTYPEGYPYYTNIPAGLSEVEVEINIYGADGEWYDSYSDWVSDELPAYTIELGDTPEDAMITGTYTITAQFLAPEDSVFEDSEIAEMEFEFVHPGKSLAEPSVTWNGETIAVTGEDVTEGSWYVMEVCYLKADGVPHMSFYSQGNLEDIREWLPEDLEDLKADVEEKKLEDENFIGGKYVCRVRLLSDYIFETYHSDYSDWCELTEKEDEPAITTTWSDEGIPVVDVSGFAETVKVQVFAALFDGEGRYLGGVWANENTAYDLSALADQTGFAAAAEVKVFAYDSSLVPLTKTMAKQ